MPDHSSNAAVTIDQVIRARKTVKVVAQEPQPTTDTRDIVNEIISTAGQAPFHYPCAQEHQQQLPSIVPWRFHMLDSKACRDLLALLEENNIQGGKIMGMLAAADAMIQVTFLPDGPATATTYAGDLRNMEHIAAASAATQNLLLAATARGVTNYWSSGGVLREPLTWQALDIPAGEVLIGSVFLFPSNTEGLTTSEGKLRDLKGEPDTWARWCTLNS